LSAMGPRKRKPKCTVARTEQEEIMTQIQGLLRGGKEKKKEGNEGEGKKKKRK